MSTEPETPSTAPLLAPAPPVMTQTVPAPAKRQRSFWPIIGIVGFFILAGGEAYLWHLVKTIPPAADESGQIAALQGQLAALQATPPAAAAAPATPSAAAPDAGLADRLATLTALVNALQTQSVTDHAAVMSMQASNADLPKLSAQMTALQSETDADHAALAALQTSTAGLTKLTDKITVLSRLSAAGMALEAGQPLGDIPNAPPALAKFAATPPPTGAQLVLSFPAAARAAESASVAGEAKTTYWSTVRARLENLVTISNGSHVIIGAPAAAVLQQARDLLNAGDLPGAVKILGTLSQTTQDAMGSWLGEARDLLAARNAIVTMAGQT